jgi:signal transduction histidine kinase
MELALRTALAKLDKELRTEGAEVTSGTLPVVSGNPDRLAQVFEILLRNALRYRTERAPRIHISAEKQDNEWLFSVRDNGPGIEADYLERVFQPFERLHAGNTEGAGMGLTICRAIVERHGGRIRVESEPGAGSTFLFTLPAEA